MPHQHEPDYLPTIPKVSRDSSCEVMLILFTWHSKLHSGHHTLCSVQCVGKGTVQFIVHTTHHHKPRGWAQQSKLPEVFFAKEWGGKGILNITWTDLYTLVYYFILFSFHLVFFNFKYYTLFIWLTFPVDCHILNWCEEARQRAGRKPTIASRTF